jgi:hypothetical protein
VYQVTVTVLDKMGVFSEWSWEAAAAGAVTAVVPMLRWSKLRAHLPIFALLVAMDRWDRFKVQERMRGEGVVADFSRPSGSWADKGQETPSPSDRQ